jgi:hypothetical protein
MAINSPNVLILDSEDAAVTRVGSWGSVEDAEAVGGSYLQSNVKGDYLQFSFKGSALWIRFKFGSNCGKASITIDDKAYPTIDLYSDLAVFKYVNVAVGLDENVSHTVKIGVDGTKNASSTDYYVNVDAFMYRTTEEALSLQNIEYIDLINVINTINRINEIKIISNIANIDLIREISNVGNVANISNIQNLANLSLIQKISLIQELSLVGIINEIALIRKIGDAPWIANIGQSMNGDFETGNLAGWYDPAGIATVTDKYPELERGSKYSCNLKASSYGLIQVFTPPFPLEAIVEASVETLSENPSTEQLEVMFFFTDGLHLSIYMDRNTIAKTWQRADIWAKLQEALWSSPANRSKHVYAIWFRNSGTTDGLYIDAVTILTLPTEHMLKQKTLKDLTLTVASGATAESDEAGAFPVESGQTLGVSLEYKSNATLLSASSSLTINVKLKNADGTVNQTLSYTIPAPQRPGTDWAKLHFYKKIPSGAAYATITATFTNAETTSITINVRNIKAWPVSQTAAETRWSIPREPKWIDGAEVTAPAAGTALASVTVGASPRTGRVFGVHITAGEANSFQLVVGTTVVKRFTLGTAGTIHIVLNTPLADNIPAGTTVKIVNVNAGSTSIIYQASLLYDEG